MNLSDVKFLKMRSEDYGKSIGCTPVVTFPEWYDFNKKYHGFGIGREMSCNGSRMLGDNRERFKRLFGKPAFNFSGLHYFHGWLVDLGTAQVIVLTARKHGTCYEVVTRRDGKKVQADIPRVLEFMELVGRTE